MQIVRNVYDQFDHAHIPVLSKGAADKAHIQLQGINREMCQHAKRRIACSEIVHFDAEAHAHAAQFLGRGNDLVRFAGIGGFRDFQGQVIRAEVVLLQNLFEYALQVRCQHVDAGYVHRYRHGKAEAVLPVTDPCRCLTPYELVQVQDQAVILKQRDEYSGADQAEFRVVPANQGFCAGQDRILGTLAILDILLMRKTTPWGAYQ